MIQPLRTTHRWIFVALAFVLVAIFIAALYAQRAPIPNNPTGPTANESRP